MPFRGSLTFLSRAAAPVAAALLLCSCQGERPQALTLADGIQFREDRAAGVQIVTLDREVATYRPEVVALNTSTIRSNVVGDAMTPFEWAQKYGALVAINGGFFGDTYDSTGRRKQIVQLLALKNKVLAPGTLVASTAVRGERYIRSAIGFDTEGRPSITWATGSGKQALRRFDGPINPTGGRAWDVESAVACGPHLIHRGKLDITDRRERLVHNELAARMAVAYSERTVVFCRANAMTYAELGRYLLEHFAPTEAMCLDGGPSAQLVIKDGASWRDIVPTGVQVPTAILLVDKRR